MNPQTTTFSRLNSRGARWILAAIGLCMAGFAGLTLSPWRSGFADYQGTRPSDVLLYKAEVDRIRAGESYYAAAGTELRQRGYPTRSVFNWRTPLPMCLLGLLPEPLWGQALLSGLALAVLCLGFAIVADECGPRLGILFALAFSGTLMFCCLGDIHVMPELWSGVLIALSVCLYGRSRPAAGLAAGLAALFVRELAAPYCLLSAALALRGRRWSDFAAWCAWIATYGLFFAWHAQNVAGLLGPHEPAHEQGWVRLGGAAFVISTAQVTPFLLLLPQWVTAIYLVLALVGLASWSSPTGERIGLAVAGYVVAFGIVGHDFNQYWGLMYGPLLCFGLARSPLALRDLWRAADLTRWPVFQSGQA